MLQSLVRKTRNFLRLPQFSRLWFIPIWLLLGVNRALILTMPFPRLARSFGQPLGPVAWIPLANPAQTKRAHQIGQAVGIAARHTPWQSNCFPQALAARLLLALYHIPCAMYFGLMRDAQGTKAHAWVAAGPVAVAGGPSFDRYTVVGTFASCLPLSA